MKGIQITLLFFGAFLLLSFSSTTANRPEPVLVVLDVAHGGKDSGFTTGKLTEKQIVLQIAQKILAANTNPDLKIVINRSEDSFQSLSERVAQINALQPDAVLSLHSNGAKEEEKSGFELYVSQQSANASKSAKMASLLQNEFKSFTISDKISRKNAAFYLLKNVKAPVVLMEMGYLTNPKDKAVLESKEGQEAIAAYIVQSLNKLSL